MFLRRVAQHIGARLAPCDSGAQLAPGGNKMLHWSLVFLVFALIAAVLGFGGLAGAAVGIAKILFFVFLIIWLVAMLTGRRAV